MLGSTCGTCKIYQDADPVTMMRLCLQLTFHFKHHLTLEIGLVLAESKDTGKVGTLGAMHIAAVVAGCINTLVSTGGTSSFLRWAWNG